jgi:hypothetical protein
MTPQLLEMAQALEALRDGQVDGLAMVSKSLRGSVERGEQAELELGRVRAIARKRKK